MNRKIIQITVSPETEHHFCVIFALCEDGSLWRRVAADNAKWIEIPEILFLEQSNP